MPATMVDLVLLVDTSDSMKPCFERLRDNLSQLLGPLRQGSFSVRIGLVGYAAGRDSSGVVYDHTFLGGSGIPLVKGLYSAQGRVEDYFTTEPSRVMGALTSLVPQGNEDTLVALDLATDFPFGPTSTTRRVIAVFTDEKLEDGISGMEPLTKLGELAQKLVQRKIQLFVAAPASDGLFELGEVPCAQIEEVAEGDGLKSVNFTKLLAQMGKSISVSTLQGGPEPAWKKALYGQDRWDDRKVANAGTRQIILAVGESTNLSDRGPITRINVKLKWTAAVDLDLHCYYRTKAGAKKHVWWMWRNGVDMVLDKDAGIGNVGGQNEENITITSLDRLETILFATKIFSKGGCFADYDGKVTIETNNGDDIIVPLTARERADWCVIAKIKNPGAAPASVANLNHVMPNKPN